jgi:hypothetical protein
MHEFSKTIHFTRQYKFITKKYGCTVSAYLSNLIDQHDLRTSGGRRVTSFFLSRNQIADDTGIKRKAQITCEQVLVEAGIISIETRDYNANLYTINYQEIENQAPSAGAASQEEVQRSASSAPTQVESPSLPGEGGAPSLGAGDLPTRVGANYISTRSTTKTVRIPERTKELIQSEASDSQSSCIKKSMEVRPVGCTLSVDQLVQKYNKAMNLKQDRKDLPTATANILELHSVEHLLNPVALEYVWKQFSDKKTKEDVKEKRIGAFIKYHLLEAMIKHQSSVSSHCMDIVDQRLDSLFGAYSAKVDELLQPRGFTCDKMGSIRPMNEETNFSKKNERQLRSEILRDHLLDLLPRDRKNDMMKVLEAI